MIKTAVIGTGSIGLEHLTAVEHSGEFKLCAVCDIGRLGKLIMYEERSTTNYFDEKRPKWFLKKSTSGEVS